MNLFSTHHFSKKDQSLMNNSIFIPLIAIFFISHSPLILAQQPYIRKASTSCNTTDASTSALGYTCNGLTRSCRAYLTFRAQPPFNSISTISKLLLVSSWQLSRLNSLPENAMLETNQVVLVPITCSCSGKYYQANASYVIEHYNTYFLIANNTFQGLTTCQALKAQNSNLTKNLYTGEKITVPLRCACPTKNQTNDGVNYLLSYLITWKQYVSSISALFEVDTEKTLAANGLTEQDHTIYPFTTLLVPLTYPPRSVRPPPPPPPPSAAPPPSGGSGKTWIYAVLGGVGGFVLASVIMAIVFCLFFVKQKRKAEVVRTSENFKSTEKTLQKEVDEDSQDILESIARISESLKVYTIEELRAATEDFSSSCLIKGSVYRGMINGDFAAIKKMSGDVTKEIKLLNKINHFNLIRLSGACFNEGHWYLVYEYAANGSLSDWIHHNSGEKILNWKERLQIALDVATGLNYLHNYASPPHVHKDLNSSNVLLDRDFRAKITNFGSAEGQEGQFALTKHIVGTKGYIAPEYLENGLVSTKLDVYAFGVLMLEILTGKEASLLYEEVDMQLSEILLPVLQENEQEKLRSLIDPLLQENYPHELAILVLKLIDSCLKKDPSDRPSTDDIFQSLSRISSSIFSGEWAISISEPYTMPK